MYCKYCGAELENGKQFCTNCGGKNESKKLKKDKCKKSKKPKNKLLRFIIVLMALILLLWVVFWGLARLSISPFYKWNYEFFNKDVRETVEYNIEDYVEDLDDYYGEKSKIVSVTPISKSKNIQSEREFTEDITKRGFVDAYTYSFYKYDMDGSIHNDDNEVSSDSKEKHPIFEALTYLDDDSVWHLYELDGEIMAYPVSYLSENKCNVPIVVSESDEIVSYDSIKNSFYRTIPKSEEVIVFVIDKITADSLKNLEISAEVTR